MIKDSDKETLQNQYLGFIDIPNLFEEFPIGNYESFNTINKDNLSLQVDTIDGLNKHLYLGKRAEYFLLNYLQQQDFICDIYHSIQIQDDKNRTLGEVDFLYYDKHEKNWVHLELITKFYIYHSDENNENINAWIGPNLKDKLNYKIEKLYKHQLSIIRTSEGLSKLNTLGIDGNKVKTKFCYKAKLFLPSSIKYFKDKIINPECISGKYFNLEEFKQLMPKSSLFYIPNKVVWVVNPSNHNYWYSYEKALDIVRDSIREKRSCLVWTKDNQNKYHQDFVVWW